MDTDAIILKADMLLLRNTLAYEHNNKHVNAAVASFDAGHQFLRKVMEAFPRAYRPHVRRSVRRGCLRCCAHIPAGAAAPSPPCPS